MKKSRKKLSVKIITLFPEFINGYVESFGILKKAASNKLLEIKAVNLRDFGLDQRQAVDDRPYGGGVGMVLRPDVLYSAICSVSGRRGLFLKKPKAGLQKGARQRVVMLTPQGKKFTQKDAQRLAKYDRLVFVAGRYEGFDERARNFADEELSIGDYVLMGGELPALVVTEAVLRLRPGILGKIESTHNESFAENLLEYPQYTKPEVLSFKDGKKNNRILRVPKVLLSGNHQKVDLWRREEAVRRTKKRRPDLLSRG